MMKKYDVIIIGGGPSAIVTGTTIKKRFPDKKVLMLTEEEKGLVPCGIPYIFHELDSVEKNAMGPKPFIAAGGEVLVDPAVDVDTENKIVTTKSNKTLNYNKLVFATGSIPVKGKFIKGYDLENVFYVKKSYKYIEELYKKIGNKKNIIIIGGGFIGAEVAEQLSADTNKKVTLIETEDYCFSKAFSQELSKIATEQVAKTNTVVQTSTSVTEIIGKDGKVNKVRLSTNEEIEADAVIMAIGYKPNTEIAKKAGLPLNKIGAIIVDNYERTPIEDVCAVGDCSQTIGFLTGTFDNIMLASTATAEARVLGYNIFGIKIKKVISGTLGIFSTKINGFAMAAAGLNESNAKMANVEFLTAKFSDVNRHPGTLPGTSKVTLKIYFSPSDGSVLGGEVWGCDCAGELINTIGMAIQKNVTVYELTSYQIGTHPLLTAAPTKPLIVKAAEAAIAIMRNNK